MTENNDNLPVKASFQNISSGLTPMAMVPNNFTEFNQLAFLIHKSGMAPKDMKAPETIFVAMMMGAEVGLAPMQSLQNIAVINGRPSIWGDTQLALCRQSQLMEYCSESMEGDGDDLTAICKVKRKGDPTEVVNIFSVRDAKKAGLWDKQGPWTTYPSRMLKMRARGFSLRDAFPDVLKGLSYSREEAQDLEPINDRTPIGNNDAGDKLNEMIGLKPVKDKIAADFQEGLKEELSKEKTDEETIVVAPEKEEPVIEEKPGGSEAKEQSSAGGEYLPESTDNNTDDIPAEVMTSDDPDHPFNRTRWIACRAASTLEKLVKDDAESWLTTTKETQVEFFEKWKRILKSSAMEVWPFGDPTAPAQDDKQDGLSYIPAEIYIENFSKCGNLTELRDSFLSNNTEILNHPEKDIIIAEYDRLIAANPEPADLVTVNDFLKFIYHAETTSELSMIGMKYAETIDAFPDPDSVGIWNRISEKTTELNNK